MANFTYHNLTSTDLKEAHYGVLFLSGLAKRAYARFARGVEVLFGCAFGAIGGKLVMDAVREVTN